MNPAALRWRCVLVRPALQATSRQRFDTSHERGNMDFGGASAPAPPAPLPEPVVTERDLAAAAQAEAARKRARRGRDSLTISPTGVTPPLPSGTRPGIDYPPMP